jgi:hypothetical protein
MSHKYPPLPPSTRLTLIVPGIKKTFFKTHVRYYETTDGKIYQADVYDQKLVPKKLDVPKESHRIPPVKGGRNKC